MMRDPGAAPPAARTGATSSRLVAGAGGGGSGGGGALSGNLPDPEALVQYKIAKAEPSSWWIYTARTLTCCVWPFCLHWMGKRDTVVQQAWREKVALCIIILFLMTCMGFLTFGLKALMCPEDRDSPFSDAFFNQSSARTSNPGDRTVPYRDDVIVGGLIYSFDEMQKRLADRGGINLTADWHGQDITGLFLPRNPDPCTKIVEDRLRRQNAMPTDSSGNVVSSLDLRYRCSVTNTKYPGSPPLEPPGLSSLPPTTADMRSICPDTSWLNGLRPRGRLYFFWEEISALRSPPHMLFVFNGAVMNMTGFYFRNDSITSNLPSSRETAEAEATNNTASQFAQYSSLSSSSSVPLLRYYLDTYFPYSMRQLNGSLGSDGTRSLTSSYESHLITASCLAPRFTVGFVDVQPVGCVSANAIVVVS
ncbi:Chitin synthase, class 3, partial [Quaeritorhiza haematococci]